MQLEGEKLWQFWEQAGDVLESDGIEKFLPPSREVILKAGQCMTVPRGVVHRVSSLAQSSYHVTIGYRPAAEVGDRMLWGFG